MEYIKKILFIIHHPIMLSHYKNIWANLPCDIFDVLVLQEAENSNLFRNELIGTGIKKTQILKYERFSQNIPIYKFSISNHPIRSVQVNTKDGVSLKYLPEVCSEIKIRCMYGADIDEKWSLLDWNRIYDYCLCHGPYDASLIDRLFGINTFQMGYPKHDNFWSKDSDIPLSEDLSHYPSGYVLWMPSFDGDLEKWSSLDSWKEVLTLVDPRELVCRPHPMMVESRRPTIEHLIDRGVLVDLNPSRDTSSLVHRASHVLTDFGGSIFVALYCGKPFTILRKGPFESVDEISSLNALISNLRECYLDILNLNGKSDPSAFKYPFDRTKHLAAKNIFFNSTHGYDGMKTALYLLTLFVTLDLPSK